ncbi:uncharacterized protein KGF55_004994 [Candida pseudojiufengensis]|uniref:uncharacterized protein n=1 Tax=Candida pseudojiufengensis TaxID=497109 RepID=UPI0022254D1D|nr:uncharacterized protein KGF55_004994 [Candida pseudojiufengensis]KAI5959762.1 hypothetical protein KGF55_004994 [Candida pseudojiufengensis]
MSLQSFDQSIAINIKVVSLIDQVIKGSIYTYSSSNEILVLKTSTDSKDQSHEKNSNISQTYRIINTSFIKSIQVLPPFPSKSGNNKRNNSSIQQNKNQDIEKVNIQPINIDDLKHFLKEEIRNYEPTPINLESTTPSQVTKSFKKVPALPHKQPRLNDDGKTNDIATNNQHETIKSNSNPTDGTLNQNKSIALKLYHKLSEKLGVKNVKINSKQNEIIVYKDIKITKPFTNTSKNIIILNKNSKYLLQFQKILKQFWLDIDNEKKGG